MRKYFIIFSLSLLTILGFDSTSVRAETTTINARIIPLVWYSTLSIDDKESIKIYAGIQNNSGLNFTGTVTFYVEGQEIAKRPFSSNTDSLIDVSANWTAEPGSHTVQAKITSTSLGANKVLVAEESDKSNIKVLKKVEPITPIEVKETVYKTTNLVVTKTDQLASSLANKIDSYRQPVIDPQNNINTNNKLTFNQGGKINETDSGKVLGISTSTVSQTEPKMKNWLARIVNNFIDILTYLIRHWLWLIGGIILIYLGLKVRRWGNQGN